MDARLEEYLDKVDKYLRPLPLSERVDIVKEIKSSILEMENERLTVEEILNRLGNGRSAYPKAGIFLEPAAARLCFLWPDGVFRDVRYSGTRHYRAHIYILRRSRAHCRNGEVCRFPVWV